MRRRNRKNEKLVYEYGERKMNETEKIKKYLKNLEHSKREYVEELFSDCPQYVLETIKSKTLKKGQEFICAGEPSKYIYIVLSGKARGKELQNTGNEYAFRDFCAGEILGDFEVLGELDKCRVSIYAQERMEVLVIPAEFYLKWMKEDIHALFLRIKKIMRVLTYQMSDERALLALSCRERIILFITDRYREVGNGKRYKFHMTQQELADYIGVTVRTIQRSLCSLKKENLLTTEAGKICVTPEQYQKLENIRREKLCEI